MSIVTAAARHFLANIQLFSQYVLKIPLRRYQIAPLQAVIKSILNQEGLEFLLIFPRQSGKNEATAHLMVYLLNLFQRRGGQMVFGAIGDGLGRGITRLEERLANGWNEPGGRKLWRKATKPTRRVLGKAAAVFASSEPTAHARGETAHILLIVDELQDQDASHIEAVFQPMRVANNATALHLGTVRLSTDALGQKRRQLERLEAQDGIKRVFLVRPEAVEAENPFYKAFLANKVREMGRNHPIVASEYFLEELDGNAGLFPPARRALMFGTHGRQWQPQRGQLLIATIDVGGQDEATTDLVAQLTNPGRDYTLGTIFNASSSSSGSILIPQYTYSALDVFVDHGGRHFERVPGRESVAARLVAWLRHWGVGHVIIDGTGVGEGLASFVAAALGRERVTIFKFSSSSKAALGSSFLSVVETGRFRYFASAGVYDDAWWFEVQAAACGYELPPGGQFDKHLRWGVPNNHKTNTPEGDVLTHDDRLVGGALIALADGLFAEGKIRGGSGESAVVEPVDPLDDLSF